MRPHSPNKRERRLSVAATGKTEMHQADTSPSSGETNHPLAIRMAVIAFLNMSMATACIFGSFSVLLGAVEARLGVGRELSTLAIPVVSLATAISAPIIGMLAARYSIRLIMLIGTLCSFAGFVVLALTANFTIYLLAFGLLLGPGMAMAAVLPPTLITRWFVSNRGRVMGIATTPIVIVLVPLLSTWTLQTYGVAATYGMLAALSAIPLIANLFIVDNPPQTAAMTAQDMDASKVTPAISTLGVLGTPQFWGFAAAFIASVCSSMIITAHMVPLAKTWGLSPTLAASLLSIQSFAGIFGTLFFGWLVDRLGGGRTLAVVAFDAAILWLLLLLPLPFAGKAVIVALIGVHGAGVLPVCNVALSEKFGRENFSRAVGLINLVNLPFTVVAIPAAAIVYARTGSYAGALVGEAAFLLLGSVLAVMAGRTPAVKLEPAHAD
jgi:MFS family permease